ncbi:hypothetical protein FQR65_LT16055 [Abscondita terminalis]|nr:hypothetical protein FQR65_LT16055 [Abscondita terminalis]
MNRKSTDIEEVVVVGYGTQRKSDLTGSVASINKAQISAFPLAGHSTGSAGTGTGCSVLQYPMAEPGKAPREYFPPAPEDVESVEVLKDASATAIYGSRGANGCNNDYN